MLLLLLLLVASVVSDSVGLLDGNHQAPLSLGFSRQEYWSGLPVPSPLWSIGGKKLDINEAT